MRKQITAGNWKMHLTKDKAITLVSQIKNIINERRNLLTKEMEMILIPPFPWVSLVSQETDKVKGLSTGAQNCAHEEQGALTGEVSADIISSAGAQYVIIGHSERRHHFQESHELLKKKTTLALSHGLTPIFCCGENLQEREGGKENKVIEGQLTDSLFSLSGDHFSRVVIAYEPVWAIGTGKTATPEQAGQMHTFIRDIIKSHYGKDISEQTSLLYGGSCKPGNAKALFAQPDVDGGLIGGASLNAKDFTDIFFTLQKK